MLVCERVDRAGQAVAFLADRGWVAELAGECRALCEGVFELVLGAVQRRGQPCAVDEVRVLVAGKPALVRDWQPFELATEQVTSLVRGVAALPRSGAAPDSSARAARDLRSGAS